MRGGGGVQLLSQIRLFAALSVCMLTGVSILNGGGKRGCECGRGGGVCVIAAECVCVLIMVVVEMRQGRLRQRRTGRKKMGCVCARAHIRTRGSLWRVVVGEGERRPTGKCRWRRGPSGQGTVPARHAGGTTLARWGGGHVQGEGGW